VSSSSSTSPTIATQLEVAFALLARSVPTALDEIARRLGTRRVRITVDDEAFDVIATDKLRVTSPTDEADVTIATSRATIRDVLAGITTMDEALHTDGLEARGTLRDLVAVLNALEAFVHGAVRCEHMAELFDEFQTERVA
jgi:hypothetical protein